MAFRRAIVGPARLQFVERRNRQRRFAEELVRATSPLLPIKDEGKGKAAAK